MSRNPKVQGLSDLRGGEGGRGKKNIPPLNLKVNLLFLFLYYTLTYLNPVFARGSEITDWSEIVNSCSTN